MTDIDAKHFHKIFGPKNPRITYQKKDFFDYAIMSVICAIVLYFSYGPGSVLSILGVGLSAVMIISFFNRHGYEVVVPVLFKRPQEIIYSIYYKVENLKLPYFFAIAVLLAENYLIALTPTLPHHVELMHKIALFVFYAHLIGITLYRTVIFVAHLHKKDLVREILMQSSWKGVISRRPSITGEIIHAYLTGLWCHIVFLAPWYLVITYFNFSVVFLPVVIVLNIITEVWYLKKHHNDCFYRDHWLGHNSEAEFLYFHGAHHDAIPSAMIAVGENGPLEGFFRQTLGFPTLFYNPITTFIFYSLEVQQDMFLHQYIPGIYPKIDKEVRELAQHSTHHYHRIEPYSLAVKIDQPQFSEEFVKKNMLFGKKTAKAIELDEQLTGFEWHNSRHKWFLELCAKYDKWEIVEKTVPTEVNLNSEAKSDEYNQGIDVSHKKREIDADVVV